MPVDAQAEVLANTILSPDYNVISLAAPDIAAAARPGQFVMVKTAPGLTPLLRRPFSVFEVLRDPSGRPFGFTLLNKRVGVGTGQLFDVRAGARLPCLGPLGVPFDPVAPPAEAWLVAGGVGLAPFATLADVLRALGTRTRLFYGARRGAELFCVDVFERKDIEVITATEDGSRGARGLVTLPLREALAAHPRDARLQVYSCGPTPMMRAVTDLATEFGRPCVVSLEQVMGCGLGGCYSCVVRVRAADGQPHFVRSCVAGPVFDGHAIVWEELVH